MATSRNSKGPYRAAIFGYRFGQGPSKRLLATVTAAREWAEGFGDTARSCAIFDRTGKMVGQHVRGSTGWARAA